METMKPYVRFWVTDFGRHRIPDELVMFVRRDGLLDGRYTAANREVKAWVAEIERESLAAYIRGDA